MKNFLSICFLVASLATLQTVSAQTIYNINKDQTVSAANIPVQCTSCIVNISKNVTLTINEDIFLKDVTFNGGIISVKNNNITFWSAGQFNGTAVNFNGTAGLVSSGPLTITNSVFTFNSTSTAVLWSTVDMNASRFVFLNNSEMEATGTVNLMNGSALIAGDVTTKSKAYIKFNGGTLNEFDNSYVSLATSDNYYFNWNNYNAGGKSIQTKDNKMNCSSAGKNKCDAPVLYGPAMLNSAGIASAAMLPVKLTAFAARLNVNNVNLTWTTDQEMNSNRFDIERSTDGLNWTLVGTVAGKGNTSDVSNYSFTDASRATGTVSYRLNMVDMDGSSEFSPIRSVKIAAAETHSMSIYPNPAAEYVIISSKDASAKNVNVQLFNLNGQVVKQMNGTGNINVSLGGVHAGNYIVRVSDATGSVQSFKLIVSK